VVRIFLFRLNNIFFIFILFLCLSLLKISITETMIEMMVESTSSSSSMHEVVDDNSNPYRNIVMGVM
jgi:hypothetical protein